MFFPPNLVIVRSIYSTPCVFILDSPSFFISFLFPLLLLTCHSFRLSLQDPACIASLLHFVTLSLPPLSSILASVLEAGPGIPAFSELPSHESRPCPLPSALHLSRFLPPFIPSPARPVYFYVHACVTDRLISVAGVCHLSTLLILLSYLATPAFQSPLSIANTQSNHAV